MERKEAACFCRGCSHLTSFSNQLHLNTVMSLLTAIAPQVRPSDVRWTRSSPGVWAHDMHPVEATCCKVAWEEHRGAKRTAECLRPTSI
ncbi:hypothetical protein VZT92_020462 [Zoarces viviparus]|uniref:Uncharacterized protein n=1 Tax=Zoarces viviparus TaxID=48416 RepID=A0AAW1EDI5_ZOAVI